MFVYLKQGLVIVDGKDLEEPEERHFGPVCHDDPEGFYHVVGKNGITSSASEMFIVFYSLIGYRTNPWIGTHLELDIIMTTCRGFLNPCPSILQ